MKTYDVIIIGSGISSLVSALLLLKKGRSVAILEQHTKAGGYMHSFTRQGISFDVGVHYVGGAGKGGPLHTLLEYLGVYREDLFLPLCQEGMDRLCFPSFEVEVAPSYEKTIENFAQVFPDHHQEIKNYFALIKQTSKLFPTYVYETTTDEQKLLRALNTPLQTVLDQTTANKKLQAALCAYCCLHGVTPQETPFGIHAIVTDSLLQSAHGLRLGGDALVESFVKEIKRLGGELFLGHKVTSVHLKGQEIESVMTEKGDSFKGEWILSGIHPKNIFALVRSSLKKSFLERLDPIKESLSLIGVYGKYEGPSPFKPLKNYHLFAKDSFESLSSFLFLFQSLSTNRDLTLTLFSPSHINSFLAWKDLNRLQRKEQRDYKAFKEQKAFEMLTFLSQRVEGFKKECFTLSEVSTPLTHLDFNGSPEGSAYGLYHSIDYTGPRALGPRTHIKNLLLTGQSTLFPGVLGAAISGLRSSGHIIGIKHILEELKEIQLRNRTIQWK